MIAQHAQRFALPQLCRMLLDALLDLRRRKSGAACRPSIIMASQMADGGVAFSGPAGDAQGESKFACSYMCV